MAEKSRETQLPPHHPLLRLLYAALVVAMFVIGFFYVRGVYSEYAAYAYTTDFRLRQSGDWAIVGLSETFSYLDGDFSAEIGALWERFTSSGDIRSLLPYLNDTSRVYVVYDEFDEGSGTFRATIGYESESFELYGELQEARVYAGQYAVFQPLDESLTMSTAWEILGVRAGIGPAYISDFEVFDVDESGNVLHHELWASAVLQ